MAASFRGAGSIFIMESQALDAFTGVQAGAGKDTCDKIVSSHNKPL